MEEIEIKLFAYVLKFYDVLSTIAEYLIYFSLTVGNQWSGIIYATLCSYEGCVLLPYSVVSGNLVEKLIHLYRYVGRSILALNA